ncbi:MAG: hypothetical protein LBG25_05760 [Spirochaetaceae bacterium]|jgi:hypothetical protein|nr:hypothetical protein [Spirochaetaceae bacterium]
MKKFLEKLRRFWWLEFRNEIRILQRKQCHRNDEEYELKKRLEDPIHLERFGYKVYSQNDEDGIIDEIFKRIGTEDKRFVEFGVENGLESNGHFLLHKGWHGIWIDADRENISALYSFFKRPIEDHRLIVINAFITTGNINQLIGVEGKCTGKIDLLSIDVDGNDYWIWEAIRCIDPRVVVIEYNAKFPPSYEWVMKYNEKYIWQEDDEQGASLKSLELLGKKLGYQLVGTNLNGVNAFFVKKALAKDLFPEPATAETVYNPARWNIQYVSGHPCKKYIGN